MRFCVYCFINKLLSNFLFSSSTGILLLFWIECRYQINADFNHFDYFNARIFLSHTSPYAIYTAIRVIDVQHMPITMIMAYSRLLVWSVCIQVSNMHHVYLVSLVICIILAPYVSSLNLLPKTGPYAIEQSNLQNVINNIKSEQTDTKLLAPSVSRVIAKVPYVIAIIIAMIAKCVHLVTKRTICCCCCETNHNEDDEENTTFDA